MGKITAIGLVVAALLFTSAYRAALNVANALECRCDTCCELVLAPILDRR